MATCAELAQRGNWGIAKYNAPTNAIAGALGVYAAACHVEGKAERGKERGRRLACTLHFASEPADCVSEAGVLMAGELGGCSFLLRFTVEVDFPVAVDVFFGENRAHLISSVAASAGGVQRRRRATSLEDREHTHTGVRIISQRCPQSMEHGAVPANPALHTHATRGS